MKKRNWNELIGQRFGKLAVQGVYFKRIANRNKPVCVCECECCGDEIHVHASNLVSGNTNSCRGSLKFVDLTGQRFGKLVAVSKVSGGGKDTRWLCRCDCGKEVVRFAHGLKSSKVPHCGCVRKRCRRNGYVFLSLPNHPNADSQGKVYEHVVIMSQQIGRALLPEETVHHKNGVKDDNRPENLELWASNHPSGQRTEDLVEHYMAGLVKYRTKEQLQAWIESL